MAKLDFKNAIGEKTKQALNNSYISSEQIKQNIRVLEELRSFIPSPTDEEWSQLEKNIVTNGCKDALLLWETTQAAIEPETLTPNAPVFVLVDGHNRYQICTTRNISFNVQVMSFASLKEVKDYMIDLQLGRRNLSPQQASYFRGLRYNLEKSEKGKYDRNKHKSQNGTYEENDPENHKSQNGTYDKNSLSTSRKLAKEYKVGRNTILRDAEFAAGLDKLDTRLKNAVLSGEMKIGKSEIQKLAKVESTELIASEELEAILTSKESDPKVAKNADSSIESAKKQLVKAFEKIKTSSEVSVKDVDKIIELAQKLKKML
ncbi:hypothetical protein [Runella slithyformis]|uniref:ParB/Sulfiredoxin domain-containing protein n=1 Tax=Runella slithyformis (strain ATCC 29530 / DSM 19594 / LMG 11500 / NCIMB 11436 / LSU 4) TaxID=761193 RepID=A0A7U3ZRX4_RUNSL|nr:hypothetical protein [Runella slithyformis]AEI52245.1 hypothetical protein Runsl_5760 [Runella slithyformis DSM 19594]